LKGYALFNIAHLEITPDTAPLNASSSSPHRLVPSPSAADDEKKGDMVSDGKGGVWHIVRE
jgi:hypothetical protein